MSKASEAFDAHIDEYDKWFDSAEGRALFASEVGTVRLLMVNLEHPFLEIGVGTGRFAKELAIDAGIDPSERALVLANKRGIKVQKEAGEDMPFADASFGAVFTLFTLCFVETPAKMFSEAARVLKTGGSIIVGIINRESAWGEHYMRKKAEGHPIYRHARFYSSAELSAMLKTAGLHVEDSASSLFQPPSNNPYREEAHSGLSDGAGFTCIRARKAAGETNERA
jgi:ubiquinone/menaquinone biosynthesis C-methylase UbiE